MSVLEISLLVVGIVLVAVGFLIPQKKEDDEAIKGVSKEAVLKLIDEQMSDAKTQLNEMVEETVSYSIEKTERAMERLTNEKITAVSEYADTVLKDINKNHQEVIFLYDMLNDKHEELLETVKEAGKLSKPAEQKEERKTGGRRKNASKTNTVKTNAEKEDGAVKEGTKETGNSEIKENEAPVKRQRNNQTNTNRQAKKKAPRETKDTLNIEFEGTANGADSRNNNEKILTLYKEGKSNMAIAKELGLGVGEVKLVIDLYKGMSS